MQAKKHRNSSIEIIKLIAVVMIVISHAMPDNDTGLYGTINLGVSTTNIQYFIMGLLRNLGAIGNDIFVVCSAWFLCSSQGVNKKKLFYIVSDCFVVSVIMFLVFYLNGFEFSIGYSIKQFLPVTFGNSWFLTCYLLLYATHPLLNIVIKEINKNTHFLLCGMFLLLYCIASFLLLGELFFYSKIIGFVGIYFIVAFVKKYCLKSSFSNKSNICMFTFGIFGWIVAVSITNYLGLRFDSFKHTIQCWNQFINPFFIIIAISLLNLVRRKNFLNKTINYLSSLSILIYIIHCNRIVRDYVRFNIWSKIKIMYTYDHILMWIFVYAFVTLILSILLAVLYKLILQKTIRKIVDRIYVLSAKIYRKWRDWIYKMM